MQSLRAVLLTAHSAVQPAGNPVASRSWNVVYLIHSKTICGPAVVEDQLCACISATNRGVFGDWRPIDRDAVPHPMEGYGDAKGQTRQMTLKAGERGEKRPLDGL